MTDMIILTLASSAVLMLLTGLFTRQEEDDSLPNELEDETGL